MAKSFSQLGQDFSKISEYNLSLTRKEAIIYTLFLLVLQKNASTFDASIFSYCKVQKLVSCQREKDCPCKFTKAVLL